MWTARPHYDPNHLVHHTPLTFPREIHQTATVMALPSGRTFALVDSKPVLNQTPAIRYEPATLSELIAKSISAEPYRIAAGF